MLVYEGDLYSSLHLRSLTCFGAAKFRSGVEERIRAELLI